MSFRDKSPEVKNQKNVKALGLIGLGVVIGIVSWVGFSAKKTPSDQSSKAITQPGQNAAQAESKKATAAASSRETAIATKDGEASGVRPSDSAAHVGIQPETNTSQGLDTTQVQHILAAFAEEQRKVFVSDEDRQKRKQRYNDPKILQSMVKIITEPAKSDVEKRTQDLAGEFMVAAMESGSELAFHSALEVMKASAFENPELVRDSREQMAGVTGEIAYNFLAYRPREQAQVQRALRGPVGQKIFENSVQLQTANLEESRTELAAQ